MRYSLSKSTCFAGNGMYKKLLSASLMTKFNIWKNTKNFVELRDQKYSGGGLLMKKASEHIWQS